MTLSDQDFREEFKPIYIPASYDAGDTLENRVIFALASLEEGSAEQVFAKLKDFESGIQNVTLKFIKRHLFNLYDKGLLKGNKDNEKLIYNLSKITDSNTGYVNPELLAPGLD